MTGQGSVRGGIPSSLENRAAIIAHRIGKPVMIPGGPDSASKVIELILLEAEKLDIEITIGDPS